MTQRESALDISNTLRAGDIALELARLLLQNVIEHLHDEALLRLG